MSGDTTLMEPDVWAACTECETAWLFRRCLSFTQGWMWLWCPDCKCGQRKRPAPAPPHLVNADGPIDPQPEVTP